MVKTLHLNAMSADALWLLYDDVRKLLTFKMTHQKRDIEQRLRKLQRIDAPLVVSSLQQEQIAVGAKARRPYPKVMPNYRNPAEPSETWSGRGNKPRWLSAQIADGKTVEQFLIRAKPGRTKHRSKRK
jgi:DNA-binding protein H-NS